VKVAELSTTSEFEADMMVIRLKNEDIPVRRVPPTNVGGLTTNIRLPVSILVPEHRAEQAREVLENRPLVEIAVFVGKDAEGRAAELIERLKAADIEFARFPFTPDPEPPAGYTVRILVDAEDQEDALDIAAELGIDAPESPDG
jgi:hypothetical protein